MSALAMLRRRRRNSLGSMNLPRDREDQPLRSRVLGEMGYHDVRERFSEQIISLLDLRVSAEHIITS